MPWMTGRFGSKADMTLAKCDVSANNPKRTSIVRKISWMRNQPWNL